MNRLLSFVALVALAFVLSDVPRAGAYPKPSLNPISWQIDFTHDLPNRITFQAPGDSAPKAYWYLPFHAMNKTAEEQQFIPMFELVDDRGNVHKSDQNIPSGVFEAIKKREAKKLMEPLEKVSGRLLVGPDQAKDSVAIWPEPIERMGTFTIFVTGLSGEAVWFKDGKETPLKGTDWVKNKPEEAGQVLRKTLQIDIQIPGDEFYQGRDKVIQKDERWVMR
jgi:hypothetical protein